MADDPIEETPDNDAAPEADEAAQAVTDEAPAEAVAEEAAAQEAPAEDTPAEETAAEEAPAEGAAAEEAPAAEDAAASDAPPKKNKGGGGGGRKKKKDSPVGPIDAKAHGSAKVPPRLKVHYNNDLRQQLKTDLGLGNIMEVPRIEKIVTNMGVGEAVVQGKLLDSAVEEMAVIVGQRPQITRAKKSIANFKLREGNAIGCKATLRGDRMWEFFDRLVSLAIPRIRDFRGLNPRAFDGKGNYTFGVTEQLIFPEISYDQVTTVRGMDITIVTSARDDREGKALLDAFKFPFREEVTA
jgi:large subunit ribosomal protein L5